MKLSPRKLFFALALSLALFPTPVVAQGCRHWAEVLLQSFFPRQIDEQGLREIASVSPEKYFEDLNKLETEQLVHSVSGTVTMPDIEPRLRFVLKKFYDAGFELYGVRLNPENLVIVPQMDVNAAASGSWILFNQGLLSYFLDPAQYLVNIGAFPSRGYTVGQYNYLVENFGWKNDWDSIYFILAHEAAHNLMRHRDERLWTVIGDMFGDHREAVVNYRKDVAHGRSGGGVKRYLWQSVRNFLEGFEGSTKQKTQESEADVVALLLLQRAGFDPRIGLIAGQRIAALVGPSTVEGWQGVLSEALCSTHPDWIERIQQMQVSLNCLRFSRDLCEGHITLPVEDYLSQLQKEMNQLDAYHRETLRISEMTSNDSAPRYEVKVEVEPKDAQLLADGQEVSPGRLRLAVGRRTLVASKEGFEPSQITIVVFPDVQPKVKIKLKRGRRQG